MKILVLTQNISNITRLLSGLEKAKQLASTVGLNLEYSFQDTGKKFSVFPFKNDSQPNGFALNGSEIMGEVKSDFRIACLIYDWTKYTPQPTNPITQGYDKNKVIPMQIPEQWYGDAPEVLAEFLLHEICHAGFFLSGQKDTTHDFYTSQFSQVPDGVKDYYLFLLKDLKQNLESMPNTQPTYTYFKPATDPLMVGVSSQLMAILDKVRGDSKNSIKITSGFRTPSQNASVNGSANSAHLRGLAIDFFCTDNTKRTAFIKAILNCGTPVFLEIAKNHIHIDIDSSIHKMGDTIVIPEDE